MKSITESLGNIDTSSVIDTINNMDDNTKNTLTSIGSSMMGGDFQKMLSDITSQSTESFVPMSGNGGGDNTLLSELDYNS